jgi:hypothetical protein
VSADAGPIVAVNAVQRAVRHVRPLLIPRNLLQAKQISLNTTGLLSSENLATCGVPGNLVSHQADFVALERSAKAAAAAELSVVVTVVNRYENDI